MSRPKRPTQVHFLEVWERAEDGELIVWADVGGHEINFQFPARCFVDRKLLYGLARVVRTFENGIPVDERVEDLVANADEIAQRIMIEEHLDRFEEHDHDWRTQTPPVRYSRLEANHEVRAAHSPREDLHKTHRPRKRAPERLDAPIVRVEHLGERD